MINRFDLLPLTLSSVPRIVSAVVSARARVFASVLGATFAFALVVAGCTPGGGTAPPPATCGAGLSTCGGTCVNTSNNASHCGRCNMPCASGQVCDNGSCTATCSASTTLCGTSCVNSSTDPTHCGNCTTSCRSDQVCSGGACGCPAGQSPCNGVCAASCGGGSGGRIGGGSGGTIGGSSGGTVGGGTGGTVGGGTGGTIGGGTGGRGGTIGGGTGGTVVVGTPPPGWWTSGTWHGCSWTAVDVVSTMTRNMPQDFVTKPAAAPYCVMGSVGPDPINSATVALLGFNLNETQTTDAGQCAYKAPDPTKVGPPGVSLMTGGATGLAVSYDRLTGSNIRVQIQGPNGGMNGPAGENDRWCYTITQVQGPIFAPFSQFNTHCWDGSGTPYTGQPISAISFLVPGISAPSPFSYCVGGFATGTSVAAAPAYTPTPYPTLTGTIGGPGIDFLDFQRVKVAEPMPGGRAYIIQNNNWGTPAGTDQTITYSGNSFTVVSTTGNVTQNGVPASFPSIYIGANGQTPGQLPGVFATTPDNDGLPRAVTAIQSLMTTFSYNRASGDYNATYDIWLAAPPAPAIGYNDALSGFVMVWLYQPPNRVPIGTRQPATVTIGGNTYDVWVGPRGTGTNPNRPVVSYVANPNGVLSRTFDLKPILVDAASRGIPSNWLVTDVFAGFEIWTGSSAAGLQATRFTAVVQ